jgi:hypothetical protein
MNSADRAFSAVIDHQFASLLTVLSALEPRPLRTPPPRAEEPTATVPPQAAQEGLFTDRRTVAVGDLLEGA